MSQLFKAGDTVRLKSEPHEGDPIYNIYELENEEAYLLRINRDGSQVKLNVNTAILVLCDPVAEKKARQNRDSEALRKLGQDLG
jgi:hypothetical protein